MTSSYLDYNEKQSVNMCKETVVADFKALFRTSRAETNETTKNLSGRDSQQAPPECRSETIPLRPACLVAMFHTCF